MQETWVQSLSWEDPLEGAWQPTPVFLPEESPEEPGGLQLMGLQSVRHSRVTKHSTAQRLLLLFLILNVVWQARKITEDSKWVWS